MDRNKLIGILNDSVKSGMTALDSRHTAIFNGMLNRGVEDKLISPQERANYSKQLNQFRETLFAQPLRDANGQIMTKNKPGFDGKTRVRNMTVKDLLEYDKDEQGNINIGKYRVPDNALIPFYENGQIGKVVPQNVGETLGKEANLAKQFAGQQQAATELEKRSGESALTPGAYASMAAGGLYGIVGGLASDAQAIARIRSGEDRNKVFQDIYGEQTASPTEDAFGFGAQGTRFIGQTASRGALPAVTGMIGAGIAGAAGTAAGLNPFTGLAAGFAGSMAGAAAGQKAQEAIFNALAGDTGKQLIDPNTGKPMVDKITGKPVYEDSFRDTSAMQAKMGEGNVVGNIAGNLLPNLVAGSFAVPAILDFKKIGQVARLGMAARSGEPAAIAALGRMGISAEAAESAIALQKIAPKNTGIAAKLTGALAESRPVTAGKTAMQWLGEASGVTKTLSPIQQQMRNAAIAIKAHPELGHFLNELGESAAETGTELQQAIQNHQQIKEYNAKARALGLEEQAEPSLIEDLVNVLGGVAFEGEHRLGTMGYHAGAALVNKPLSAMGFDVDPYTRAISADINAKTSTTGVDNKTGRIAVSDKAHVVGLGNGEFSVVDPETKTVRIASAHELDPRLFGLRTSETAPTGQGARMAEAAETLVGKTGILGRNREYNPVGENKETVVGITHEGYAIRRQVDKDNNIDVRAVSVDQLHPENQKVADEFFSKAGMKANETKGFVEDTPYTTAHEVGNIMRSMKGMHGSAFKDAFPAVVALDQNITVHGRVIKTIGDKHVVVQIPTHGNGTDIVVVPKVNLMTRGDSIKAREAIDDNETNIIDEHSKVPQDETSHNPLAKDTDRITSPSLDGGRNPVMLTPEQAASAGDKRSAISAKYDADVAGGMAAGVASKQKGKLIKAAHTQVLKDVATDSGHYPAGSYIEHTNAAGKTVGAVVIGNTTHGPIVRPLDNGLPYVAQHTTITSGEPTRPITEPTATTTEGTATTPEGTATTPEGASTATTEGAKPAPTSTVVKPEDVKWIEVTVPKNPADPFGDSDLIRIDTKTGELWMPDAIGTFHRTSQPSSLMMAQQTGPDGIERVEIGNSPQTLNGTSLRQGFSWSYNVKTGEMKMRLPSKEYADRSKWETADAADYRTLDSSGKAIKVGEPIGGGTPTSSSSSVETPVTPSGTIKEEVPSGRVSPAGTTSDVAARTTPAPSLETTGTMEFTEKEDKAVAEVTVALGEKTISDLIAQKPRTKQELEDALTDFLIGTPYKGRTMTEEEARSSAKALTNFYDRMIFGQATRILQMTQDRLSGFKDTRVASPGKKNTEFREHHERDLPVIGNTIGMLDEAAKALSSENLTWSEFNKRPDAESKKIAAQAVDVVRRKLIANYYESSVPAIGKFEKIPELNEKAQGFYTAIANEDGQVVGRLLVGFAHRDFSTAVHEIGHALLDSMPADMQIDIMKHMGHTPRIPTPENPSIVPWEVHEKFATSLEASFLNAEHNAGIKLSSRRGAPTKYLENVFSDLAPFMRDVYGVVYGETSKPAQSLTWRLDYQSAPKSIFLWDNMPLIVDIDGANVRCKIPMAEKWWLHHQGPGRLGPNDPTKFEVEVVEFGHPLVGKRITITNASITAVGGLTNGFNKRMASAFTYWMGERSTEGGGRRQYTGLTKYSESSPAAINSAKAKAVKPKPTSATTTAAETTAVVPESTAESGTEPAVTPTSNPTPTTSEVVLPAPQMADKSTFVSRTVDDIKSMPGTEKLDPEQLKVAMEALYDANRQNSSIARDKWKNYEYYGKRSEGKARVIGIKDKATGIKYLVNMDTGAVKEQAEDSTTWTPVSPEKVFARQGASAMPYKTLQAGIDAMWQIANAPENLKPQVKGFLHYIAQLHGQAKAVEGVTTDWLPMPRNDSMPKTAEEATNYLSTTQSIDGNTVTFEATPTAQGDLLAFDYDGRKIIVANINGVRIPFYVSTGKAGKVKVQPGRWYPFFGVGPVTSLEAGWINKGTSDEIVSHYGSPTLKAVAEHLDKTVGDLRGISLPKVDVSTDPVARESINTDLIGVSNADSAEEQYNADIRAIVSRVEASKDAAKATAEALKETRKEEPSPLQKSDSADAAVLNAVGMKDLTQDDLDAIGRELLPEQYEKVNNADTPIEIKEALLRLGYAKRIAKIITASSTDREIAQGDMRNSNARQALQKVTSFVNEVIIRSRQQVLMAEEVDSNGRLKVLSDYELLTAPTETNPVISMREKSNGYIYNVNVTTGDTTITLPDGTVNTQKPYRFIDSKVLDFYVIHPEGTKGEYSNSILANQNMSNRGQQLANKQGIPLDKMPQVYPGMLHIARMLAAVPIDGKMVAPVPPVNVLWKINDTKAFSEVKSRPVFQLRQADRNAAVGTYVSKADVKKVDEETAKAIANQDHNNHTMQLIDKSEIMRVKSQDEPTSAQELRRSVIDARAKEIEASKDEILSKLRAEMHRKGSPVVEGRQPFVYRVIEPTEYIDEDTGVFALEYETDENGDYALDSDGNRIPVLDNDGEPVKATRFVEKYVLSYAKQPMPTADKATVDMSQVEAFRDDGSRISQPLTGMERAVKASGSRYIFYDAINASKDGNGSTKEAQDFALGNIVQSYKILANRMMQKYTPIVKWDGNPLAGQQVWARATPTLEIKTPTMNGVPMATVQIGAAKTAYNIDAVGATNRWQSREITRYGKGSQPVSDLELQTAVAADDKHYYAIVKTKGGYIYKMTATNINTKDVGVFQSEKTYATEAEAKKAVAEEYLLLRGQAYEIWHKIGAERIANDVVRLAELSRATITGDMTYEQKAEIVNAQVIMRQYDWYRGVASKIMKRYGSAGLAMADLVGGTSPQTPVDSNWTNAVQALQMMNRGTYERIVRETSGEKGYNKVPFNTERAVQVYAIYRALQAKAAFWRGANTDGTAVTDKKRKVQRNERFSEYSQYVTRGVVNKEAIRAESDETLKNFLGDEIVSKLETKIPENLKRKMLEDVAISLVDTALWTKSNGGQDPVASFTGWAQRTDDWLPIDYTQVIVTRNKETIEKKHTNQTKKMDFTVLPRNVFSGSKFGANTDNVLQGMFNTWLDIADEGQAPKARNFSLNLVGLSSGATIDVWAARYVRRMYHEWHQDTEGFDKLDDFSKSFFARVPPAAEQGVEGGYLGKSAYTVRFDENGEAILVPSKYKRPNPAEPTTAGEFGTGQAVMGLATDYINNATGGKLQMLPSDLQAIVWFAEKQLWSNNGWTNASGAGGSFEYQFAQDVLRYGDLERFNVMMSGNGVQHLNPAQKERLMQIMRKTLWTNGTTGEGSPVAHLSALISNSSGDQTNPNSQTQLDINLVAKRGSTPLKPYDPENDIHALILNLSPDAIRDILNGKKTLSLPTNLLNEHANRRLSLAVMNGRQINIIGTGVFDGGQQTGEGLYTYNLVPSNELTDSRSVIADNPPAIKNLPDNADVNTLIHIKPNMWVKKTTTINGTSANALYPARTDTGKHRRIREHVAYNVNLLKNAAADMLRITGGNDAVISRVYGEPDGTDDIEFDPNSNVRIGHEIYFKPALADERIDDTQKRMYNERFSNMMRRMQNFFADRNAHVQYVVQQDPRNQYSHASLVNGNVGILAVWCPETEMRYMDYGAGLADNMLTQAQKDNNAKLMDYLSGDPDRIRKHEEQWNNLFKEFWTQESQRTNDTIPIFQSYANHYDVNTIHKEALKSETAPTTGIDDQSIAWGLGIREKLEHSVQQLGIGIRDGRVFLEADTRSGAFDEVLAGNVEAQLQNEAPLRVGLYKLRDTPKQQEFHMHCTSYAGSRLPGLNGVYDYAMDALLRGNQTEYEKAMTRLSARAGQEVTRVFAGMEGVEIKADRNTGIFFGDVEPSIDASITIPTDKYSIDDVLARAAHMGLMFRQQNVYVTQDAARHEYAGEQYDGYTVEHRAVFNLSEPITFGMMRDIQKALNLGGANLSQDGKTLTTFTVSTEGETFEQTSRQWYEGLSQISGFLQTAGVSATFTEDACRLWNTGSTEDGAYGKFTSYGQVLDNLRRRNPKALVPVTTTTDINRNVEEVRADVEFALSTLRGRDIKLPTNISFKRTPLTVETQMAIADNYDRMPMNAVVPGPYFDPMVKKAYQRLVSELDKQWKWLNVKIEFMPSYRDENGEMQYVDSYDANSAKVIEDIRNNNHLYIYPTTPDTFGEKGMDFTGHPLLEVSPHKTADGKPMLWNDVLRAVHDALAHSIYGASFGANGEEIAFATHALLTDDPMAIWALSSETRAQNSWVNFNAKLRNPDGSMMTDLPPLRDRAFAAQKAALMPIQTLYTGIEAVDNRIDALRKDMEDNHEGYNGSIPEHYVVESPLTDGFKVKGRVAFQLRTPAKTARVEDKVLVNNGDIDILASDCIRIDPDKLKSAVAQMYDVTDANKLVKRLAVAYLGHIQRGDVKNPAPDKGTYGYHTILRGVGQQIKKALKDEGNVRGDDLNDVIDVVWANATMSSDEGVDTFEPIGDWYNKQGDSYGNRILNPVTNEYVNHHGQPAPRARLETRYERDSHGRIMMYHATIHGAAIGNEGKLLAGDDVSWMSDDNAAGLGGTTDRISLTYNKTYAVDVIKMLTNYFSIMQSSNPQKALNNALTARVDEAIIDNEPGAINDRVRYKFTQLAWQLSHPEQPDPNDTIPTYDEAYDHLVDLYKVSGSVDQFVRNLADMKYTNEYGTVTRHFPKAEFANKAHQHMGTKTITTPQMAFIYHDYIGALHQILGMPYTLILRSGLQKMLTMKDAVADIKPVIYQYAVDPNMLAEHTPFEEELRTYTTGIMEHTGKIFDYAGDEIDSVDDGFVPSRPAFSWTLPRKGSVPVPPPAPAGTKPPTGWDMFFNAYDKFNDLTRLSVGGDASPILIQNFMLANPIEDPKLFFHQFLIMTKAARPNLSLSWKGKTIVNGKNYGREADIDLGNELRANHWYENARGNGLTLSAFAKDEALKELQKTNPSATLMDINELGYNQDVSVTSELMQHLPGQGASERFFSMSKDYVKMTKYAQSIQHLVDIGYVPGTEGFEGACRDIAAVINVSAGDMKFSSNDERDSHFGRIFKRLLFAPRWATSRFALDPLGRSILLNFPKGRELLQRNRMLDLQDRDPYAKGLQTRMMAKTYGMWMGLALLYGLLYRNEAVKTSISKGGTTLSIGDYKIKPPAGIDKTIAMISAAWSIFDSNDKMSKEEKITRAYENMKTMILGQAAPGASAIWETVTGRNLFDEPSREVYTPLQRHWDGVTRPILAKAGIDLPMPKFSNMMADKFIYLWAQDMMESYEALKDRDEPYALLQSTAIGASSFIGGRVKYAPKDMNWKYDAAKGREAPGIANTIIGATPADEVDMQWDKLTQ